METKHTQGLVEYQITRDQFNAKSEAEQANYYEVWQWRPYLPKNSEWTDAGKFAYQHPLNIRTGIRPEPTKYEDWKRANWANKFDSQKVYRLKPTPEKQREETVEQRAFIWAKSQTGFVFDKIDGFKAGYECALKVETAPLKQQIAELEKQLEAYKQSESMAKLNNNPIN